MDSDEEADKETLDKDEKSSTEDFWYTKEHLELKLLPKQKYVDKFLPQYKAWLANDDNSSPTYLGKNEDFSSPDKKQEVLKFREELKTKFDDMFKGYAVNHFLGLKVRLKDANGKYTVHGLITGYLPAYEADNDYSDVLEPDGTLREQIRAAFDFKKFQTDIEESDTDVEEAISTASREIQSKRAVTARTSDEQIRKTLKVMLYKPEALWKCLKLNDSVDEYVNIDIDGIELGLDTSSEEESKVKLSDDNFAAVEYERNLQNLAQAAHSYWKTFVESEDYRGNSTFQDYDENDKLLWRMAFMRFMTETMVPDMLTGFELAADSNLDEEERRITDAVKVATYTIDSMPKNTNRMHKHLSKKYEIAKKTVKDEAQKEQELKKHEQTVNNPKASARDRKIAEEKLSAAKALDAIFNARGSLSEAKARALAENRKLTFQEQEQIAQTTANIISEINTAVGKLQTGKDTIDQAFAQIAEEELKRELDKQPDESEILKKVQQLKKAYDSPGRGLYHIVDDYQQTHGASKEQTLRALAINEVKDEEKASRALTTNKVKDEAFKEGQDQSEYKPSELKIQQKIKELQEELRAEEKNREMRVKMYEKISAFKPRPQPRKQSSAKRSQPQQSKSRTQKRVKLNKVEQKTDELVKTMAALFASGTQTSVYDEDNATHVAVCESLNEIIVKSGKDIDAKSPIWAIQKQAQKIIREREKQSKERAAGAGAGAGAEAGAGASAEAGAGAGAGADAKAEAEPEDGSGADAKAEAEPEYGSGAGTSFTPSNEDAGVTFSFLRLRF